MILLALLICGSVMAESCNDKATASAVDTLEKAFDYDMAAVATDSASTEDSAIPNRDENDLAAERCFGQPLPCITLTMVLAGFLGKLFLRKIRQQRKALTEQLEAEDIEIVSELRRYMGDFLNCGQSAGCSAQWQHVVLRM